MRSGEACQLKWTDIDLLNNSVRITPEKGSNPRNLPISNKLVSMLNAIPKDTERVFTYNTDTWIRNYSRQRKRIAAKLKNTRLLQITFHTFRHWKATMLYHQTKDILYVKEFLGHKKVETTLLYIQLAETIFKESTDEFTVKVASKPEEIKALLEVGFEYICEKDDVYYFRKRK